MSPSHHLSPSQHASTPAMYYLFLFVLLLAAHMNIILRQVSYLTFYRTPGSDLAFIRFKYHCAGFNFSFQSTEIFGILILSFGMTLPRPATTTPSALQGGWWQASPSLFWSCLYCQPSWENQGTALAPSCTCPALPTSLSPKEEIQRRQQTWVQASPRFEPQLLHFLAL